MRLPPMTGIDRTERNMRIIASDIALSATTSFKRETTDTVEGRVWTGNRPPTDNVQVSETARVVARAQTLTTASAAHSSTLSLSHASRDSTAPDALEVQMPVADSVDAGDTSETYSDSELLGSANGANLVVLRRMVEAMTGRRIRIAKPTDGRQHATNLEQPAQKPSAAQVDPALAGNGSQFAPVGWGIELDVEHKQVETSAVAFAARGSIVTEDGQTLSFDAQFVKQSTYVTVERFSLREGDAQMKDPLVLLYSGTHAELTERSQAFDLAANGELVQLKGIANGAYVVRDKNANGKIDDGTEMLGAITGDGFAELRALDEDGNGFLDAGDRSYETLALMTTNPHGEATLTSLKDAGIAAIFTASAATAFDLRAPSTNELQGRVRTTGIYVGTDGAVRPMEQIDLKV